MPRRFIAFARGLATNWLGAIGVVLTTTAFVLFSFLEVLRLLGVITNTYVGLLSYLALPSLFVVGLLMIPGGWWLYKRRTGLTTKELLSRRFAPDLLDAKLTGSTLATWVLGLTVINILFLGAGGARMLRFMDEPGFCGTACHSVMGPEWATYQQSPHARVACVECHVGDGADALIDSKINGLWQMISVTFDLYERPIPTPVHNLRPARETCETCHWPDKFYGQRLKTRVHYAQDAASTPSFTTLGLEIGSGHGDRAGGIHWHVAGGNRVEYGPADPQRREIAWVKVAQPDGSSRRFTNRRLDPAAAREARSLDCVDCHNRATHIYEDPEEAVDERIAAGLIDRTLPFAKLAALAALGGLYRDGATGVELDFRGFYRRLGGGNLAMDDRVDAAVEELVGAYQRNIHPGMNVGWNVYPDHRGHKGGGGCFRCHNPDLVASDGRGIAYDCTSCHSILADESPSPFAYLEPAVDGAVEGAKQVYLRAELMGER